VTFFRYSKALDLGCERQHVLGSAPPVRRLPVRGAQRGVAYGPRLEESGGCGWRAAAGRSVRRVDRPRSRGAVSRASAPTRDSVVEFVIVKWW